jgi:hypothetical protein
MKKTLLLTAALLGGIVLPAVAFAETPVFPGAQATPCDPDRFSPIFGKDGVTVLYWNNPTCRSVGGGAQIDPDKLAELLNPSVDEGEDEGEDSDA